MASVWVLYIDDDIVGPHLELVRNVCEPASTSRPHVTVRYFERLSVPQEYLTTKVREIDLLGPGSFGLRPAAPGTSRTVFIKCKSDDLAPLEHKPHYPSSEFHITLYDGKSVDFAKALLKVLKRFKWGVRLSLPADTTLKEIEIKPRRRKQIWPSRIYSSAIQRIFYEITSQQISLEYLLSLTTRERIKLVGSICKHLHQATTEFRKLSAKQRKFENRPRSEKIEEEEIHLTPPELAREITEYAVSLIEPTGSQINFGDPAVGTGAFYSALLQVLPRKRITSAIGIDISAEQVDAARSRWAHKGMQVKVGDYLHMERLQKRTLILANPPYLRHQKIRSKYKQGLRERASVTIGIPVSARSGLYVYFLILSHAWMKQDAVAAWLIPSEFMQTNYGSAIRQYLTQRVQLIRIHKFDHDDPQFERAMVLPAVVVFRNRPPSSEQTSIMSSGGSLANPKTSDIVNVDELRRAVKWFIPRRAPNKQQLSLITIGELFEVRRGIATGANEFFVMERATAARLGIPNSALRPILPKARALVSDIVERQADGYPQVRPQLCLLDYYLPEDEIKTRHPHLFEYLATAKNLGILNRNLLRKRHPWYKQEKRAPAPFLCTYMGRHGKNGGPIRFIWNKSEAIVTNTYLMLYPRAPLAQFLKEQPEMAARVFDLLRETARETMKDSWRVHAGGLYKIEPGELLSVPLPSNPKWLLQVLDSSLTRKQILHPRRSGRSALA